MTLRGKKSVVVCGMLGERGGGCLAPLLLCQELARLDLRVTCFTQLAEFLGGVGPENFQVITPLLRKGCRWDLPGKSLAWQARRWICRERPDFVFVAGVTRLARYLLQSEVADRLLVWEFTNANPGNKFVDRTAARLLDRALAVLSPSRTIDQAVRKTYGYSGRLLRLPFWIEATEKLEPKISERKSHVASHPIDFIYLGRRDEEKGLRELLQATAQVVRGYPKVLVLIAGPGSEEPYASWARDLGLSENAKFEYFKSREETLVALAKSRCLILPSYHEGYPLVLLEAMRAGVPCIATAVGSVPEVYGSTRAALLVPPRDERALADAMLASLRETPASYEARRLAAREVFQNISGKDAIDGALKRVFSELQTADCNT